MSSSQTLIVLLLGGLMGLLGQGSRAVVGLKTMTDDASDLGVSPSDLFQAARLLISLAIGFLVGLAAALIYISGNPTAPPDWHILLGFAAAGYTGTDFLEAFISKYLNPTAQPNAKPAATNGAVAPKLAQQVEAADYAIKIAEAPLQCGSVNHGVAPITAAEIKLLVLQCYAKLPGANPSPPTTDSTKISDLMGGDDPIYYLAQQCQNFGRFDTDGLMCQPRYFRKNGTTLGGFVQCIQCCCSHPKTA